MASSALPDVTGVAPAAESAASQAESETAPETDGGAAPGGITWEREDVTLDYLVAEGEERLPCICEYEDVPQEREGQEICLSQGLKVYSREPVLMYSRITKTQARARSIYKDKSGVYFEIGQTLIIPADYPGWFEVVPSDFSRATCYTSIESVAKAMPARFFTRSNLKGIRIEGEGEEQKYLERKIPAGSVLGTNGTFTAKWKTRAETGLFKKKTKEWHLEEVTYLKCVDQDSSEILVPVAHKGKFNAIYERGQLTANAVYSMKDILSDLSLPIMVRLLFGKAPVVPCIFTGMLIIRDTAVDDSIIGSSILNKRNVLFEIPITAPVKVKYTSNDECFAESEHYKDAKKLCRKYSGLYSTMIKLSPNLDTDQKVIQHVPSDPSLMRQTDEALRALDLITDISLTSEPQDHLLDASDAGSVGSQEQQMVVPAGARLVNQSEQDFKSRESHTHV